MNILPAISLYIHIPWCSKKCPYCDFNSYAVKIKIPEMQYINHLILDLKNDISLINNRNIHTIFIGGGTPSLLKAQSIRFLLNEIKKIIFVDSNTEITIEINPKTINYKKLLAYKEMGINRFSIGIQTFNIPQLKKLGRYDELLNIEKIIQIISNLNLKNINFDLMYGLPDQSYKNALLDLEKTISLNPQHISWYQLTIEPNTIFYAKKLNLPTTDEIWKIWKKGKSILSSSGYQQYEISSYAKKGYRCQHNLNYWHYDDYLGIGCGAHGKITQKNGNIIRLIKKKSAIDYMNGKYINKKFLIKEKDKPFEYFINNLRLFQPISHKHFREHTFMNIESIKDNIKNAIAEGYLIETSLTWKTTKKGKLFLNSLLELFLN